MHEAMVFDFEGYIVGVVLDENGQAWFKAGDVCRLSGFCSKPKKILKWHCNPDNTKKFEATDGRERTRIKAYLNLRGTTLLTDMSPNPRANRLKQWILTGVMPTLQKRIETS
ncbi:MAG: hypothetical protein HQL77_19080 [Magnetococcales bacterium]|nr:hypothetical protein [Magnetococcales bacterium]